MVYLNTFENRMAAAKRFEKNNLTFPIYVDAISDETCLAYGALPDRLYIVMDGTVEYEGALGPGVYDVNEVNFSKKLQV